MNRDTLGELTADAMIMTKMLTNMVRNDMRDGEQGVEAMQHKLALADAVCLHAELKEHLGVYDTILKICRAAAHGRYLDDYQRGCNCWSQEGCRHACTSAEQCEGFIEDDPYEAILFHLDELQPLSEGAVWAAQTKLQRNRALSAALHKVFPESTPHVGGTDEDGNQVMVPVDAAMQAALDAQKESAQAVLQARVAQYDAHRELLRQVCRNKGRLREILALVEDGLPLQETVRGANPKLEGDRPPQPPSPGAGLVYEWSELLGEYLLVRAPQA